MHRLTLLPLLLLNLARANPTPLDCFAPLVFLSPSETPPIELIRNFYLRLFDTLDGHRLGPEALKQVAESDDLFALPDQNGANLDALGRHLKQFEQMMKTCNWLTSEVRQQLREALQSRAKGMQTAVQHQAAAVRKGWLGQRITLPSAASYLISPDGRWVLTRSRNLAVLKREPDFHVYDTFTKSVTVQGAVGSPDGAAFAADGSAVLFPENERVIRRVPFEAGRLQWSKAENIGAPWELGGGLTTVTASTDPSRVYAQVGQTYLCAFDLTSKTRTVLTLRGSILASSQRKVWGVVPGTTDIYIQYEQGDHSKVSRYSVNEQGQATLLPGEWRIPYSSGATLLWTRQDKLVEAISDVIRLHVTPGVDPILLKVPPRYELGRSVVSQVMLHPTRNEVGVLLNPTENTMRIDWYDLDTGAVVGTTKLPGPHYSRMKMADDGEKLFLYSEHDRIDLINANQ